MHHRKIRVRLHNFQVGDVGLLIILQANRLLHQKPPNFSQLKRTSHCNYDIITQKHALLRFQDRKLPAQIVPGTDSKHQQAFLEQ